MGLSDEDKAALRSALERMPDSALQLIKGKADRLLQSLDEANSAFPETKAFLETRGLTRVSQLDDEGKAELVAHLRGVLRKVAN